MPDESDDLNSAVSELDDAYLKVVMLLAVRRATSEEPRRAGFWHSLAGILAAEQEKRRHAAEFRGDKTAAPEPDDLSELSRVMNELRRDLEALETEYRESYGRLPPKP
ncbi:MAG TPA: hypothetical protein VF711_06580 [Acidimicrobiales bacterium]|jgi:hypothetical protein